MCGLAAGIYANHCMHHALQEEQYFEGTGGVLLDVSHASPHPYHGVQR